MTNVLEWTSWSRHRKLYGFNKYVKNYELRPVAAEVWRDVRVRACARFACTCACKTLYTAVYKYIFIYIYLYIHGYIILCTSD